MDFNGPPRWEHLLTRLRGHPNYNAGGFFGPLQENFGRPDPERPEDRINNPPPPREDQEEEEEIDVVGSDQEDVLERCGGDADNHVRFDQPTSTSGEDSEDELSSNEDQHARAPTPPPQQLPPNFGMDWRQQAPNFHLPGYYPMPPADTYACPFSYPHAPPFAPPYSAPFTFPFFPPFAPPYSAPFTFPFFPPFAPPYSAPFTFPFFPPFAPPYSAPFTFPFFPPFAPPYSAPFTFPFFPPFAPPYSAPFIPSFAPPYFAPSAPHFSFPHAAPRPDSHQEEDQAVHSSCGLSSSTRRRREENEEEEEEAAAKRPRWSDESDSD